MDLEKSIIVDFDDTLCIHDKYNKSEIANGKPNKNLIEVLNKLDDAGYSISIFTARGHHSASSREEAEQKYKPIITKWLNNNGCRFKYTLSFNKPYGIYYIDDKALRPDEIPILEKLL